jgi:hypothetical protein
MTVALQLAEFLGASWALWRLSAYCYRPRPQRNARDVDRWPVPSVEPAARADRPAILR